MMRTRSIRSSFWPAAIGEACPVWPPAPKPKEHNHQYPSLPLLTNEEGPSCFQQAISEYPKVDITNALQAIATAHKPK
jgi:hypothetical protein